MPSEAEFTKPHRWCPNPERWTAPDTQATEYEVVELVAAFVRALQPEFVIETGTHHGYTAEAVGQALARNGHGHLDTVEVDPEAHSLAFLRTKNLPVTCLLQSSMDYTPPQEVDFAWFDSLIHLRVSEFCRYRPWMHERTVVGFHDTGPQHSLRPQLDELSRSGLQIIDLPTPRGVVFGRVWA